MKIAVAYNAGQVFNHFGQTKQFEVYEIEGANIISRTLLGTEDKSHGALVGLLESWNINVLFVGGIGTHAVDLLENAGIKVFTGVLGDTESNVNDYLNGVLKHNPAAVHQCSHH